jgi:hypothetical protein
VLRDALLLAAFYALLSVATLGLTVTLVSHGVRATSGGLAE